MDARDAVPMGWQRTVEPGGPEPLGSTPSRRGTNFAIHAPAATRVTLALFAPGGLPRGEHPLDPARHFTGGVWHVFVPRARAGAEYGWRADSDTRESGPRRLRIRCIIVFREETFQRRFSEVPLSWNDGFAKAVWRHR